MNLTSKPYTETDRAEFDQGFDRGNMASAYETEDYEATVNSLCGENGFYRIGHILGFFSSFELDEIPYSQEVHGSPCRDEVDHYRAEFSNWI